MNELFTDPTFGLESELEEEDWEDTDIDGWLEARYEDQWEHEHPFEYE